VPTFRDHTEPYLSTCTPVLPAGPGVCQVCHGAPGQGFDRCSSCVQIIWRVSFPVRRVALDSCCLELDVPPEPPFDLDAS
jgi:hypothetical protein